MSSAFAVFFAEKPDSQPRLPEYIQYMRAGVLALRQTNPDWDYIVLTDQATAPKLENEFDIAVTNEDAPLMLKYMISQQRFVRSYCGDFVVLAASDCVANKRLNDATDPNHSLAITYRLDTQRINNVGYARDMDLTAWFLSRSIDILAGWPSVKQVWLGDQESWESAIGHWDTPASGMVQTARPEGRLIHLYPHKTHNCFASKRGPYRKESHKDAFLLHFKGPRKEHMVEYVRQHIRGGGGWNRQTT